MKKVTLKAAIIVTIETNNPIKPVMSFKGNDLRKSCSAYREVRIDKNISIEVEELNKDRALHKEKTIKEAWFTKTGVPLLSTPPGRVKAAAKTTVAMRVATTEQDCAVCFIHSSPFVLKLLCSLVNKTWGEMWSLFSASAYSGLTTFSTACKMI